MISIQLPDGSQRQFPAPVTVAEVAASIGAGLAKAAAPTIENVRIFRTQYPFTVATGQVRTDLIFGSREKWFMKNKVEQSQRRHGWRLFGRAPVMPARKSTSLRLWRRSFLH